MARAAGISIAGTAISTAAVRPDLGYTLVMEETGKWDVAGKTVLVTGGNCGIGRATALELARQAAHVIFTARDPVKGAAAERELRLELGEAAGSIKCMLLDLADFQSILGFAQTFTQEHQALHVLIHNAGVVLGKPLETKDGFEATFGTNHMGPFILNRLLLGLVRRSAPARIIVVASRAHRGAPKGLDFDDLQSKRRRYNGVRVYAESKLANILFTRALSKRMVGSGVTINCLHPGVVASNFTRDGDVDGFLGAVFRCLKPFLLSPEKGAQTSVYLATSQDVSDVSGAYFIKQQQQTPTPAALDDGAAEQLWEVSNALAAGSSLKPF